jgi:transposase
LVTPIIGFTCFFEAEVMELMKEKPVAAVARKVGEHDTRLWRVTSSRRGHEYVTLFVDIDTKTVMFATEGKGSLVLKDFSGFLQEKKIQKT